MFFFLVAYRVNSFVVELGVRHWIENKNISLEEGFAVMEKIRSKFDGYVCFSDPQLPIVKGIVAKIDPQKVQSDLQADPDNISLKALAQVTAEVRSGFNAVCLQPCYDIIVVIVALTALHC